MGDVFQEHLNRAAKRSMCYPSIMFSVLSGASNYGIGAIINYNYTLNDPPYWDKINSTKVIPPEDKQYLRALAHKKSTRRY